MLDYILEVHRLLQWAFNLWFVGIVFVPLFLAVALTYWVSNIFTFRPLKLKAIREVQFLRTKIYVLRGHENNPRTESDWIDVEVNFSNTLEQIAEEMELFGYISAGREIRQHCERVRELINGVRAAPSVTNFDLLGRGTEAYNRHFDDLVRQQFFRYWRMGHAEFMAAMNRLSPTMFELINCPTFAQWQRELNRHARPTDDQPGPGRVI